MEISDKIEALNLACKVMQSISAFANQNVDEPLYLFDDVYSRTLKVVSGDDTYTTNLLDRGKITMHPTIEGYIKEEIIKALKSDGITWQSNQQ